MTYYPMPIVPWYASPYMLPILPYHTPIVTHPKTPLKGIRPEPLPTLSSRPSTASDRTVIPTAFSTPRPSISQQPIKPIEAPATYSVDGQALEKAFTEHLGDQPHIHLLAKGIAATINTQKLLQGEARSVMRYTDHGFSIRLLIESGREGQKVRIILTDIHKQPNSGAFLKAFKSLQFTIDINTPNAPIQCTKERLKVSAHDPMVSTMYSHEEQKQIVLDGIHTQQKILEAVDATEKTHYAALPIILPTTSGVELVQKEYPSTLYDAFTLRKTKNKKPYEGFSLEKSINTYIKANEFIYDLNKKGYVHGDLSPENIGLGADGEPLITDFDVTNGIGYVSNKLKQRLFEHSALKDFCTKNRWLTPLCDTWQILASAVSLFCPHLHDTVLIQPEIHLEDPHHTKHERARCHKSYVWNQITPLNENKSQNVKNDLAILNCRLVADNKEANKALVTDFISTHTPELSPNEMDILNAIPNEIDCLCTLFDKFVEAYHKNKECLKIIQNDPKIQQDLNINIEATPPEQKEAKLKAKVGAVEFLEKHFFSKNDIFFFLTTLISKLRGLS